MNTEELIGSEEQLEVNALDMPGAQLAAVRIQKGYSQEFIAGKLHLRIHTVELLEEDDYQNLPQSVFIKGYLRSYAKLLGVVPEPLIEVFERNYSVEPKIENTLWQSHREVNKTEHAVRWMTVLFALSVTLAVGIWWQKSKEGNHLFAKSVSQQVLESNKSEAEGQLTDLSQMQTLLSSGVEYSPQEKHGS